MAFGFGATFGTATTDKLLTTLTQDPTQLSFFIRTIFNGAGGGSLGRLFDAGGLILSYFQFSGGQNRFVFERAFSTTKGFWQVPGPTVTGGQSSWGGSYDKSLTTNVPALYFNGTLRSAAFSQTPVGTATANSSPFYVGNRADGTRNWDGVHSEFAVWSTLLTAAEFAALDKGVSPLLIRPTSLIEYIPMVRDVVSLKLTTPTLTGGKVQPHPPVIKPRRKLVGIVGLAGTTFTQTIAVGCASSVSLIKASGKIISALSSTSTSVSKQARKTVAISSAASTSASKQSTKTISAALATSTSVSKQARKTIAAACASAVSAVSSRAFLVVVNVACSTSVSLKRSTGKIVAVTAAGAVGAGKAVARTIAVSCTGAVSAVKRTGKSIAAASTSAVALSRRMGKIVPVSVNGAITVAKQIGKNISLSSFTATATRKAIAKTVAVAVSATARVVLLFQPRLVIAKVRALLFSAFGKATQSAGSGRAMQSATSGGVTQSAGFGRVTLSTNSGNASLDAAD